MPQRLVFGFAFAGFFAWSLLVLLGWLFVNLGGDMLRLLSPVLFFGHPDGPSIVDAGADLLVAAGGWVIAAVWLAGCAVLALLSWILSRLSGTARVARCDYEYTRRPERQMRDVTPPPAPRSAARQLPRPMIDQS